MIVNNLTEYLTIAPTLDFTKGSLNVEIKPVSNISWQMKKTWRMWMSETAEHMTRNGAFMPLCFKWDDELQRSIGHGRRPFTSTDAHELFVRTYLGEDDDGERFKTASGDKGEMVRMMDQHLVWCVSKGWELTIPMDGEYMKLREAQNQ